MIELKNVSHGYGGAGVLHDVSALFPAGRFSALLGPNGAGKSTMLRIAGGELAPDAGSVSFDGQPIAKWRPKALAAKRAFLPQDSQLEFPFSAFEVAMLGRAPHVLRSETPEDLKIVNEAMRLASVTNLAARDYTTLSGGERQRVQLARVLAQAWGRQGTAMLLDEPVASLDPAHQHATLSLAREWARSGACVVAILHDVNLALTYADDAVVLLGGKIRAAGPVRETLSADLVSEVFCVKARLVPDTEGGAPFLVTRGRGE
jgi:iron complex transport system ATP-binding protein